KMTTMDTRWFAISLTSRQLGSAEVRHATRGRTVVGTIGESRWGTRTSTGRIIVRLTYIIRIVIMETITYSMTSSSSCLSFAFVLGVFETTLKTLSDHLGCTSVSLGSQTT